MSKVIDICDDPVQLLVALWQVIEQSDFGSREKYLLIAEEYVSLQASMIDAGLATWEAMEKEETRAKQARRLEDKRRSRNDERPQK